MHNLLSKSEEGTPAKTHDVTMLVARGHIAPIVLAIWQIGRP